MINMYGRFTPQRENMKYKAIFSDFDGTLYSDQYEVSQKNIDAIRDFEARGGKFFVATGRLFQAIYPHVSALGLKGEVIVYQGGGIFDIESKKVLWQQTIENSVAVDCLRKLESEGKTVDMVYIDDKCYGTEPHPAIGLFCKICKIECIFVGEKLSDYVERTGAAPNKLLAMVEPADALPLAEKYAEDYKGKLSLMRSQPFMVEFTSYGLSKGAAVEKVCKMHGLKREEIICVGDADNDIPMIRYAGLGVAVMNAMETTKAAADVIGVSNNHDAIAWIVENYCGD